MRTTAALVSLVTCLGLAAGVAAAEVDESPLAAGERSTSALAIRFLPASTPHADLGDLALEPPARWAPLPAFAPETSVPAGLLELRLRTLAGPQPPDPRRSIRSGAISLRLPLGDSVDLRPGLRLDYTRHPVEELWTSTPIPTLGLRVRF